MADNSITEFRKGKDNIMEKKVKFSDQPLKVKLVYGIVTAILIITAVVVGIVSVASRKNEAPAGDGENPPVTDGNGDGAGDGVGEGAGEGEGDGAAEDGKVMLVSPVVGSVMKAHSTEVPVFSTTLNEWRIHTGIDISAEEGDAVCAAGDGVVTKVFNDHRHGRTVEITHAGGIVTLYSNLAAEGIEVKEGDKVKSGDKVGCVGDTSLTELADEPHLHFEVKLSGAAVNPLDYISEDSKKTSLGIS